MTLKVGHITYANCVPFFHYLTDVGFSGQICPGVPAQLNRMLAAGAIDISPSSSFEYARNAQDYLLLPGHSISSCGPVQSVLLFSPLPLEDLAGAAIALTGESATSVNLLQILLREFLQISNVQATVPEQPVETIIAAGGTALLIGDRALRAALQPPPSCHIYDLGELWYRFTGLPFVFALWIVRRAAAAQKRDQLLELQAKLRQSRQRALGDLVALARQSPESRWMGEERLVAYWQAMSYELSPAHLDGLSLFFRLACQHQLLERVPEIEFFV